MAGFEVTLGGWFWVTADKSERAVKRLKDPRLLDEKAMLDKEAGKNLYAKHIHPVETGHGLSKAVKGGEDSC